MLGWFFTLAGPILPTLAAWFPGVNILRALKVGAWLVSLALISWGSVAAANWWHSDKITVAESDQRCVDTMSLATLNAKVAAVDAREHSLRAREEQVASDEEAVKAAIAQMERDRAEADRAGGAGVLVGADDEWLQRWRRGQPPTAGRR